MDKSQRDRQNQRHNRENPSFSSSLLDAIYRSIDEGGQTEEKGGNQLVLYRETMKKKKKQKQSNPFFFDDDDEAKEPNFLRSQSSNGGFSSSESSSELFNGVSVQKPKPIRTSVVLPPPPSQNPNFDSPNGNRSQFAQPQKPRIENHEKKTKFKALKKPISPGAKLASFLNSLFNSGNGNSNTKKKAKLVKSSNTVTTQPPSSQTPTCSSASSFSRSCLSKTPSSSRSGGNKINRSVRFYPVSVIVDEDCRPCGHKNLHQEERPIARGSYQGQMYSALPLQIESLLSRKNLYEEQSSIQDSHQIKFGDEELRVRVMQESKRVEEFARDLLKNYQRKREENSNKDLEMMMHYNEEEEEEEDENDDASSCSSSDLFELDNLSSIGNIERYREELPVYETTHFNTNRAIANGFMM
ncbi:protein BIG GRAIN 1-like B [Senna tora]|uniref:Protein BIG GRAIN 1-like B n=1 Tax=Senna tora TaxID=362788 RepID=A0A834XGL9_9FABA|nr:protein BIG GRAIN 1-like B [Senna tora]